MQYRVRNGQASNEHRLRYYEAKIVNEGFGKKMRQLPFQRVRTRNERRHLSPWHDTEPGQWSQFQTAGCKQLGLSDTLWQRFGPMAPSAP